MKFVITGGRQLSGEIAVSGSKNAATPIIAATLLTSEECVLDNVPRISDVEAMLDILRSIGGKVAWTGEHQVTIHNDEVDPTRLDRTLIKKMRSSVLFCGPFLARFKSIDLSEPGGCNIGNRPLNTHFHGLKSLGAQIEYRGDVYHIQRDTLKGSEIVLPEPSVTATENIVMAAALAEGETVVYNAACEPHVKDLVDCLNGMGAQITGGGTSTLKITGVKQLSGARHAIVPDMIEAGTFVMMGLATRSPITVTQCRPRDLAVVLVRLRLVGAEFEVGEDWIRVIPPIKTLGAMSIDTHPYPGIPTDLQSIFGVLATQCAGLSLIHDTLFEGRMSYIQELARMGAQAVVCDPHRAVISGPTQLHGCSIKSYDLRAGAANLIAALIANGETVINEAEIVDRGYERIEERLRLLGASIERVQ